jgi:hypothetical protein
MLLSDRVVAAPAEGADWVPAIDDEDQLLCEELC